MLKIKTYVDKSSIHGLGLFSKEFVPSGTVVWKYNEFFTAKILKEVIKNFSNEELFHLVEVDYYWIDENGDYMFPLDGDRFTNHSCHPNVIHETATLSIAARDIHPGEEITNDYRTLKPQDQWKDYYNNEADKS